MGVHIVVKGVNGPFGTAASHIEEQVQVPAILLLIYLPANAPWEAADDGLSNWIAAIHMRDQDGVLGSWH